MSIPCASYLTYALRGMNDNNPCDSVKCMLKLSMNHCVGLKGLQTFLQMGSKLIA